MVMCRPGWGSGESDNWGSPRVANRLVEDAAYARAEKELREVEARRDAERQLELETLELSAGFLKAEAKEQQQRSMLTALHQKKQRAVARHRLRTDKAQYHQRTEAPRVGGLPQEPPLAVIVGTSTPRTVALQAQREALGQQIAAAQAARGREGRIAREVAALAATEAVNDLNALTGASRLSTAPGSARQAQAQAVRGQWSERGERALKQRCEMAKEWDRQAELSLRRKGAPQDQSCRSNPRQHSAADWAVIS